MNYSIIPASWSGHILGALRIMTGLLFLAHGTVKFFGWPIAMDWFKDLTLFSLMGLAGVLEIVGGILIVLGLFTRPVAFVLSGFMAAAYFMGHASSGFWPIANGGELAIMFSFVFLYFAAAGAGPLSLDAKRG
jgi:putative oxidoreductase